MMPIGNPRGAFWAGRRVLVTGHTGFKGSWLALWLQQLGARVSGVALAPSTDPNLFEAAGVDRGLDSHVQDIRDSTRLRATLEKCEPEVVFHLAAQALVRASYRDPLGTFSTNVQGTANLLDAVRGLDSVRVIVVVTSDKVYANTGAGFPFRETDALGGHDPYSASKAAAEIVCASFRDAFLATLGAAVATARAGNVIGGGDWSEDRLIPDAVRAWSAGGSLAVRRPEAIRPWQHVLEPLCGYLRLAERLWSEPALAGAFNFGPATHEAASVRDVIELAQRAYGQAQVSWGDGDEGPHEAPVLCLETARARNALGVRARWGLDESVFRTLSWYRRFGDGIGAPELCAADIEAFEAAACAEAIP